jgi:tetratricopeptide (TPR) repeat protein
MSLQTTVPSVDERLQRIVDLKVEGRYDEAEREVTALLREEPDSARAHRELGLVFNFTGRFEESIEALQRAVELEPHYLEARIDLALAYSMLGMVEEARRELQAVLEEDPTNAAALRHIVYFQ